MDPDQPTIEMRRVAAGPTTRAGRGGRRRTRAAWALAFLATACAELTFTAVAVPATWLLFPLLLVMYGAGVVVVREAVVRVGRGWPSLVLLGVAYQLAEDGLGLQALTSPRMYGAADWGWRALGVNWTYWEAQIGVHVAFSVVVPVALAGLLFPDLRARPYLGTRGFAAACAAAVAGVLGLRLVVSATQDPGYQTPWGWTAGYLVAIAVLAVLALRVVPRVRVPERARSGRAPRPVVIGFVAFYLTMAFLTTVLPLGLGSELMLVGTMSHPVLLLVGAMTALPSGWLVVRWTGAVDWNDRNLIWLIGGALVSHTAFMALGTPATVVVGVLTIAVEVVLLVVLAKHVDGRARLNPISPPGRRDRRHARRARRGAAATAPR